MITLFYGLLLRSKESMNTASQPEVAMAIAGVSWLVVCIFVYQGMLIARKIKNIWPKMKKAFYASFKSALKVEKSEALIIQEKMELTKQRRATRRSTISSLNLQDAGKKIQMGVKMSKPMKPIET